jgi:cell shape-determining protein MreC
MSEFDEFQEDRLDKFYIEKQDLIRENQELQSRLEKAERKLKEIGNYRDDCWDYDNECGYPPRNFTDEDVSIISRMDREYFAEKEKSK